MSQEKDYIWKVNGIELELDLDDADTYESLMNAFNDMEYREKELTLIKDSNPIRKYCKMFYNFYDVVFGEGTAEKIFKGKNNARICDEVYESFLIFIQKQGQANANRRMQISSKYQPNRQQRRTANKKGNKHKNYPQKVQYRNNYSEPYAL